MARYDEPPRFVAASLKFILVARAQFVKHFLLPRQRRVNQLPTPFEAPAFPPGYVAMEQQLDKSANGHADHSPVDLATHDTPYENGDASPTVAPRSFVKSYNHEPWYFPIPSPAAFPLSLLETADDPLAPSARFRADGYRIEEIGPIHYEKMGHDVVMEEAERIQGGRVEGPYAVGGVEKAR